MALFLVGPRTAAGRAPACPLGPRPLSFQTYASPPDGLQVPTSPGSLTEMFHARPHLRMLNCSPSRARPDSDVALQADAGAGGEGVRIAHPRVSLSPPPPSQPPPTYSSKYPSVPVAILITALHDKNWGLLFYSNWLAMPRMQTCKVSMPKSELPGSFWCSGRLVQNFPHSRF